MPKSWWVMVVLAILIAGYAAATVVLGDRIFPPDLAASFLARPWGIYPHAFFGGLALALGPFQFHRGLLRRNRGRHRLLGKIYLVASAITGAAGLYLAGYSFGGMVTHLGFGALGLLTMITAVMGYRSARSRDFVRHREWVIRSFAAIFAAVTLRIELPLLIAALDGFPDAYRVIAWLCWVPNVIVAEALIRSRRQPALERDVLELARG